MTGIETVFVIHYTMFIGLIFYNLFLKAQLKDYRANEKAKKEIAKRSTFESRLLKSGGSVHKF